MNNLPPGININNIPGNRPEDEEIEVGTLVLTVGEIQELQEYYETQKALPVEDRHYLWITISNIVEQFEDRIYQKAINRI